MSAPDGSFVPPDRGRSKRVVIVGGVAGGMSTATRLRRLDADAEITVLERSGHVSFANCGLPYFVGGLIEKEDDLTLQTPEQLFARFRLDVRVNDEVVAIDRAAHTVTARSTLSGDEEVVAYDKLVLSMGAAPVRPPIPGYDRARTLRTVEDAARLASDVGVAPKTAVVIGAGFIGLEMAENLVRQGKNPATHSVISMSMPDLHFCRQQYEDARRLYQEKVAFWEKQVTRPDNIDVGHLQMRLALSEAKTGHRAEAIEMYTRAESTFQREWCEGHPKAVAAHAAKAAFVEDAVEVQG